MGFFRHTIPITAVIENKGQFLFIRRSRYAKNMAGKWVFPGGKIEFGEDAIQALYRELDEETGLKFTNQISFLSSYHFLREEDNSSTIGFVFLVRSEDRILRKIDSIEEYVWISPEDITDYTFSYAPIKDFELERKVTIPGMEVHVRNAIIILKNETFSDRRLLSVTDYQKEKCSMSKEYLVQLQNSSDTNIFIDQYGYLPHCGGYNARM